MLQFVVEVDSEDIVLLQGLSQALLACGADIGGQLQSRGGAAVLGVGYRVIEESDARVAGNERGWV